MGCASWPHLPLKGAFEGGDARRWSQRCSSTCVLAFVSNIEQIASASLSPEEFHQLAADGLPERAKNRTKSKVRARVEHPIGVIKRVFGFVKVRYRGLAKNTHRLIVTCALANLFMARRQLFRYQQV